MSRGSQLYIGRLYISWADVPAFLTFLFEKSDFYITKSQDEDHPDEIGYKTSCQKSLAILGKFGYNLEFVAEVYDFFYGIVYGEYRNEAKRELAKKLGLDEQDPRVSEQLAQHTTSFPDISRLDEIKDFIKFIATLHETDFSAPPFDEPHIITLKDGREYQIASQEYLGRNRYSNLSFVDFTELQQYIYLKHLRFPPWILALCHLFSEGFVAEFPEVITLMFVRLMLEAVPPESEIKLELSDIIDEESEAREIHTYLAQSLIDKINLYNRVFKTLFVNEETLRSQYIKSQCVELLASCDKAQSKHEKGYSLERLTELLFTSNNSLELVDKRVSTGDEEIDLVVKNNIHKPFWLAFNSPLFFIECKNWGLPVGVKEIRNFEIKLRNHMKLAKIGFFVSINGFTNEVDNELKRAGRDDYHLVLITRHEINEYLSTSQDFFSWLEKQTARFY